MGMPCALLLSATVCRHRLVHRGAFGVFVCFSSASWFFVATPSKLQPVSILVCWCVTTSVAFWLHRPRVAAPVLHLCPLPRLARLRPSRTTAPSWHVGLLMHHRHASVAHCDVDKVRGDPTFPLEARPECNLPVRFAHTEQAATVKAAHDESREHSMRLPTPRRRQRRTRRRTERQPTRGRRAPLPLWGKRESVAGGIGSGAWRCGRRGGVGASREGGGGVDRNRVGPTTKWRPKPLCPERGHAASMPCKLRPG